MTQVTGESLKAAISVLEMLSAFEAFVLGIPHSPNEAFARMQHLEDLAKQQRRVLAAKHHPDRGGTAEAMAAVNNALDVVVAWHAGLREQAAAAAAQQAHVRSMYRHFGGHTRVVIMSSSERREVFRDREGSNQW